MQRPKLRVLSALAVLSSLGAAIAPGAAGALTPEQAPPEWVAYAQGATRTITGWLNAETPPAPRVRAVLETTRPAPDRPAPPLVVKIWVDGDGVIRRVDFPPLAEAHADRDLYGLLVGRRLPAPPKRMRQPMRIGLQLAPPHDTGAAGGA